MSIPAPLPQDEHQRLADLYALGLFASDSDPAYDAITRVARQLFDTRIALFSLVDADRQWFKSRQGLEAEETHRDLAFCAHAILGDEIFVVEDACQDKRFHDNPLVTGEPGIRFYAGAPIRSPAGSRLGTLCVIDDVPRSLAPEQLAGLRDLADLLEKEISQVSDVVTDQLTGLYNRRGFVLGAERVLAIADRAGAPVTLAFADLDGLKAINDRAGHAAGDEAIRRAAGFLRDNLRSADVLARIGGDEFAMLLYGSTTATARIPLARLAEATDAHNRESRGPDISMSVGVVQRVPLEVVEALIRRADRAMYDVKQSRRPSPDQLRGRPPALSDIVSRTSG